MVEKAKNSPKLVLLTLFLLGIYAYVCCVYIDFTAGLRVNQSNSLPFTLFYADQFHSLKKNQFVAFKHLGFQSNIAKQVLGVPGDIVDVRDHDILINGQVVSSWKDRSASGKIYHPIEPQIIPEGYVYVHAVNPDSYDSRYIEFGLIKIRDLKEELWPIF